VKPGETGNAAHSHDGHSIFLTELAKKYCSNLRTSDFPSLIEAHPKG